MKQQAVEELLRWLEELEQAEVCLFGEKEAAENASWVAARGGGGRGAGGCCRSSTPRVPGSKSIWGTGCLPPKLGWKTIRASAATPSDRKGYWEGNEGAAIKISFISFDLVFSLKYVSFTESNFSLQSKRFHTFLMRFYSRCCGSVW